MISSKDEIQKAGISILGVGSDTHSSFRKGSALAPGRIRERLFSDATNLWSETGVDIGNIPGLTDLGDIRLQDKKNVFDTIQKEVAHALDLGNHVVSLGGDHAVTFPIIKAHARKYGDLNILHLDAHPDLYDSLEGDPYSHACPFARIMERKLAVRLVQGGIRTMNGHQREQAEKFNVEVHEMKDGTGWMDSLAFDGPVYLSLDLDCLDPAFAPGVSHLEPGGMSTREVIRLIHHMKGRLVGADIVEYNPEQDLNSMTAIVAAKLLKEIIARLYEDNLNS